VVSNYPALKIAINSVIIKNSIVTLRVAKMVVVLKPKKNGILRLLGKVK